MDGMDSDDSDTPLVRVDSGPKLHDTVPEDTEYHIRLVAAKKHRFLYLLKAGQTLPYEVSLQGKLFLLFSKLYFHYKNLSIKVTISCLISL